MFFCFPFLGAEWDIWKGMDSGGIWCFEIYALWHCFSLWLSVYLVCAISWSCVKVQKVALEEALANTHTLHPHTQQSMHYASLAPRRPMTSLTGTAKASSDGNLEGLPSCWHCTDHRCLLPVSHSFLREKLLQYLYSLKQPDGSFLMHVGGEVDVRWVWFFSGCCISRV